MEMGQTLSALLVAGILISVCSVAFAAESTGTLGKWAAEYNDEPVVSQYSTGDPTSPGGPGGFYGTTGFRGDVIIENVTADDRREDYFGPTYTPSPTPSERIINRTEDLIAEAERLIAEGDLEGAASKLGSASNGQDKLITAVELDLLELEGIGVTDVEELGITQDDIERGKELIQEARVLLEMAKLETNLTQKAALLREAAELEREAVHLLPEIRRVGGISESAIMDEARLDTALEQATSERAIEVVERIMSKFQTVEGNITVAITVDVFLLENQEESELKAYRSMVTLTVTTSAYMEDITLVEVFPKSTAADIAEIILLSKPEILQSDPIVAWYLGDLAPGYEAQRYYTLKKKLRWVETESIVSDRILAVGMVAFWDMVDLIDAYETGADVPYSDVIETIDKYLEEE